MQPRIGIVGAGPGGISLARLLTDRGYADVTVLEKSDRVGGKSLTVHHEGIGHEMGTCYTADGYRTCEEWMKEAGMEEYKLLRHFIYGPDEKLVDFQEFVEGEGGLLGTGRQGLAYIRAWKDFHRWDLHGAPDDETDDEGRLMRNEVAKPFGVWLSERGLDAVARFALRTMTVMGYGPLDRVPALYGLRWNVPSLFKSAVLHTVTEPVPGWQHLWTWLAGRLDVRLQHTIEKVERKGGVFHVRVNGRVLEFDHLVITSPLDEATRWIDFTPEERTAWGVGGAVEWREYATTLVEAEWFTDADTRSWEPHARNAAATAKSNILVARRTGDKSKVAAVRARAGRRPSVYVCYQYGNEGWSRQQMVERLLEDLAADGAKHARVITHSRWKYAPQLTPNAIREGGVGLMERQQGKGNLWMTGATASHEAVDNIVDYNERLVERMAAAFDGRDPSDPGLLREITLKRRLRFRIDDW